MGRASGFASTSPLALGPSPQPPPPPYPLTQFIDNFAHIGGLIGGLLIGFVVLLHNDGRGELRCKQLSGAVLAGVTYVLMLGAGLTALYFNVNLIQYCPRCAYMSCVPSPWWSCDLVTTQPVYCAPYANATQLGW